MNLTCISFFPFEAGLYDAFNPAARTYYWNLLKDSLFKIGVDAWWLDATEPQTIGHETNILAINKTAIGHGARYANLFPLMTTSGVYQGQRSMGNEKRVFILTRSAFTGMQRNAAAAWSGDVDPDGETFRRQIPAGLNFSLSGLPYWTTDIGGFVAANPDDPAYRELFVAGLSTVCSARSSGSTAHVQRTRASCGLMARKHRRFW